MNLKLGKRYSREQKHVSISDTPMLLIEINSISNMGRQKKSCPNELKKKFCNVIILEFLTVELNYFRHFVHGFAKAIIYYFIKRVHQNCKVEYAFIQ